MENQDYQLPAGYTTPPVSYGGSEKKNLSLIRELSPQQYLRDMMEELNGKVWDDRTQKYVTVDSVKPLMNEEGRNVFFHFATATINPIVTMSNYRSNLDIIHKLVLMQIRKASINFHIKWRDYGISDKTKINIITDKLMILTLSCFYKAFGAGDRSAATKNISESINTLMRPEQEVNAPIKSKSMMERLLRR